MELEDKIRCNELLKEKHSNWIGLSNQKAIRSMLEELDRLQKENEELKTERNTYRTQVNSAFDKGFIHKDKIREKIEEYKNSEEFYQNFPDDYMGDIAISLLQDLLKEE